MAAPLAAIAGLGHSRLARASIGSPRDLAACAIRRAMADAGISAEEVDGLLLSQSALAPAGTLPLQIMDDVGLPRLRLLSCVEGKGSSVVQMVQIATMAVQQELAHTVVCAFADAPLDAQTSAGDAFRNESSLTGIAGWEAMYGLHGPVGAYALIARRYLHDHGVSEAALGAYAIACRRWAALNPDAFKREPMSMQDYLASPYVAEPLRVVDCAYPVNGAAAVVVTGAQRAASLAQPPVYVHGMGQGHQTVQRHARDERPAFSAGTLAAQGAYRMAGIDARDVSVCQFYDPFSICVPMALEDYGLCPRGEGTHLLGSGATSPAGRLPVNTGGGHLAGGYLQGMTPLAEAVWQGRGAAGARQVPGPDVILVNGSGGTLEFQAALILSPHRHAL